MRLSMVVLVFLLVAGAGCKEQETKSREKGQAVVSGIKEVEKEALSAASKIQKDMEQLEQENK